MSEDRLPDGQTPFHVETDQTEAGPVDQPAGQPDQVEHGTDGPGVQEVASPDLAGHAGSGDQVGDVAAESSTDLLADLADAHARVAGLTEDLQRLQAEYVNYKRRVDRDRELVVENARYAVLSALLPVLDDIDRARGHGELEGGFKAVADALEGVVSAQGLTKFGVPGDGFDPRFHEALMLAHSPDVTTTTCRDIVTAGYQIGQRVVRAARVTVVDPEPSPEPSPEPRAEEG